MIDIVEVGAMSVGGQPPGYQPLLDAGVGRVVGFEANKPECDKLDVIRGSQNRLKDTILVVSEVEFVEMYKGQPLFADVDAEMRRQGFCLHFLGPSMGPAFRPFAPNGDPWKGVRQALWTDAVY